MAETTNIIIMIRKEILDELEIHVVGTRMMRGDRYHYLPESPEELKNDSEPRQDKFVDMFLLTVFAE